jgi:hypothetical protein
MEKLILGVIGFIAVVIIMCSQARADMSYFPPLANVTDAQAGHFVTGIAANKHLEDIGFGFFERLAAVYILGAIKETLDHQNGFKYDHQDIMIGVYGVLFSCSIDFVL